MGSPRGFVAFSWARRQARLGFLQQPLQLALKLGLTTTQAPILATSADAAAPTHLMLASFFGALAAQAPTTSTPLSCATPIDFALVLDESYSMNRWKNTPPGPNYMDGPDGVKALAKELVRHAAMEPR